MAELAALSLSAAGGGISESEKAQRSKFGEAKANMRISGTASGHASTTA